MARRPRLSQKRFRERKQLRTGVDFLVGDDPISLQHHSCTSEKATAWSTWHRTQERPLAASKQAAYRELGGQPVAKEFLGGETFQYLCRRYRLKLIPVETAVVTRIAAKGSTLIAPVLQNGQPMLIIGWTRPRGDRTMSMCIDPAWLKPRTHLS